MLHGAEWPPLTLGRLPQLTEEKLPHPDSFLIPVNNVCDAFNPLFSITYAAVKLDRMLRPWFSQAFALEVNNDPA
jgi:hypothetical protein